MIGRILTLAKIFVLTAAGILALVAAYWLGKGAGL